MSHFTVAVFTNDDTQDVDALLAPYDESIQVAPYRDSDGELTTYNPNSKWDWYSIGGRWQGELILKTKKKGIRGTPSFKKKSKGYDGAYLRDIDFEAMRKRDTAELQPYEEAMKNSFFKEEYMREKYPTEEDYVKCKGLFGTYAVITPDGVWHSPGKMGYFGISSETPEEERAWQLNYYDRFIKPAIENNWYMVIVDCHI